LCTKLGFHHFTYLCLLALLEEFLLTLLLVTLLASKVLLAGDLLNLCGVNTGDIELQGSGDNIAGVDSSERNTVDLEWAGNEEHTLVEAVEKDDTLAAETTSEEDENGAGLEGLP